ncbi:hypothetical protein C1646_663470 [Rhizophagus diaphanus]|nr:hypothetical protein C1646_663470 [Rhizophagus diaphanus] [Rhizophagus sp. MUCL 43196]
MDKQEKFEDKFDKKINEQNTLISDILTLLKDREPKKIKEKLDINEQCVSILQKSKVKDLIFDKLWDKKIKTANSNSDNADKSAEYSPLLSSNNRMSLDDITLPLDEDE